MFGIQKICDGIEKAIQYCRVPLTYIPAILLVCSAVQRPGLSAMIIVQTYQKQWSVSALKKWLKR